MSSRNLFDGTSDFYSKYRPDYPALIIQKLEGRTGFNHEWKVADIGSGTGKLSRLFLKSGNEVIGVEPNSEMRSKSHKELAGFPKFSTVNGSAESTGIESSSIDLVVCGQSFHWFNVQDARREFRRILRGEKHVSLIWNDRVMKNGSFTLGYEQIVKKYSEKYHSRGSSVLSKTTLAEFFQNFSVDQIPNNQPLTLEGVLGRYLSASYAVRPGGENYYSIVSEFEDLFARHQKGGKVQMEYVTQMYTGTI